MTAKQINELIECGNFKEIEKLSINLTYEERVLWAYWAYEGHTYVQIMNDRKRQAELCA
jgi:hypothetical protein